MKFGRRVALLAGLLVLTGCASMSDRYYVAGRDGGGDYYFAPQSQVDDVDPYWSWSGFDVHYGFGWGSPFGYGAWWNAWPYVPPPHYNDVVIIGSEPRMSDRPQRPEPRRPDVRESQFPTSSEAALDRRERSFPPAIAPRPSGGRHRDGSPVP